MNGERWEMDTQIPSLVRSGTMRLYRLINPIPRYVSYHFAVVNDNDEVTPLQEIRDNYAIDGFQTARHAASTTLSQLNWEETSDPLSADRNMRNNRENALRRIPVPLTAAAAAAPEPAPALPAWDIAALLRATRAHEREYFSPLDNDTGAGAGASEETRYESSLSALRLLLAAGSPPVHEPNYFANRARVLSWLVEEREQGYEEDDPPPPPTQTITPPLTHVAQTMIQSAIQQNRQCPITLEAIKADTAVCVAPCYHVFERSGITRWLETSSTCPECRQPCRL